MSLIEIMGFEISAKWETGFLDTLSAGRVFFGDAAPALHNTIGDEIITFYLLKKSRIL